MSSINELNNTTAESEPSKALNARMLSLWSHAVEQHQDGRLIDAMATYNTLLQHVDALSDPFKAKIWANLGALYIQQNDVSVGFDYLQQSLALEPNHHLTLQNALQAALHLGQHTQVINYALRLLAVDSQQTQVHKYIADAAYALHDAQLMVKHYQYAITHQHCVPRDVFDQVQQLLAWQAFDVAIPFLQWLIDVQGHDSPLDALLAHAYGQQGLLAQSIAVYERLVSENVVYPDASQYRDVYYNLGYAYLLQGRLREGFQLHEERIKQPHIAHVLQYYPFPLWQGEVLQGKRIVLLPEQGLGDAIQMLRFIPALQAMQATVYVVLPSSLSALACCLHGAVAVYTQGDQLPVCDYKCLLMSLPYRLGIQSVRDLEAFSQPYLSVPVDYQHKWLNNVQRAEKTVLQYNHTAPRKRVGLVCSGSLAFGNDQQRSIALAQFAPLFSDALIPHIHVHSLHLEYRETDKDARLSFPLLDHSAHIGSFVDTAALILQMDLVIAVDTAVAHLAGALGKPVWLLLPFAPDWRWLAEGTQSAWYPLHALYRQDSYRQWSTVISSVIRDLLPSVI